MSAKRALELLRAYGTSASSFQLLEPGIEHWFSERCEALVGYADTGKAWVVLGDPVCAEADLYKVYEELAAAAQEAGRRLRYFANERPVTDPLANTVIGEQPEWAPGAWAEALSKKRSLREQLRRARAKGVLIERVEGDEVRAELEDLAIAWRETRRMATMHFAVRLDLFHHSSEHRYFAAKLDDKIVAALVAVPVYARGGWLIEDLLRSPAAPNGTSELLFDAAVRNLESGGSEIITMGLAPLAAVQNRFLVATRAATPWLFDWRGLRSFKAKLGPTRWQPIYAAWPERERGIVAMLDILRCFAGGSLVRFGVQTVLHRYRAILWLLAALLIPWIAALSSAGASRFFPSEEARVAWVTFDVALFAGISVLAIRYRRALALALALAAGADACLGFWQLARFNAAHASGGDWLVIVIALAAPLVACAFFVALFCTRASDAVREAP